jgi:hypothetical protein
VCALCVSLQKSSQQGPLYFVTFHIFFNTPNSVADPGSGASFDPGIRDEYKIRIRIRDEQPGSYFRELRNHT